MLKSQRPTIVDVAKEAGVSPITASRALTKNKLVTESTRQKVFAAAKKLNYVPNLLARGLVQRSTKIIGILVINLANPYYDWIVHSAQRVAKERGYMLLVGETTGNMDIEDEFLRELQQIQIAGLLICPSNIQLKRLECIQGTGIPMVFIGNQYKKGDYVAPDNEMGGRLVAEHLLRLGYKKIGYIHHKFPEDGQVLARCKGFEETLRKSNITIPEKWRFQIDYAAEESGIEPADYYLGLPEKPEVIFLTDDEIALSFMYRLKGARVNIPKDLAVIGYNDIQYSMYTFVPLSTVALPKREMGKRAANILIDRIEEKIPKKQKRHELIMPRLVIRESCGASQY